MSNSCAIATMRSGRLERLSCLAETFTATGTGLRPARCHAAICRATFRITHSPSSTIRSEASATSMNASGGTEPWRGSFQRASASKLTRRPLRMSTMGCRWISMASRFTALRRSCSSARRVCTRLFMAASNICTLSRPRALASYSAMSAERSSSLMVVGVARVDGQADAGGGGVGGFAQAHGLLERRGDALGNRRAVGLEAVVARDHEELVAAHAHDEVGARDRVAQTARDLT